MDIAEFLIARWSEESQHAHDALEWLGGEQWTAILPEQEWLARKPDAPLSVRLFVTQQSPQRVIDDLASKARIIEWHAPARDAKHAGTGEPIQICCCGYDLPCTTLRLLAYAYAEHPDYDAGWSPGRWTPPANDHDPVSP